ncbi:MAG: tRNA (adenosine(37)-N6)-dimethylallyltransferase MiaA [Gemmatimonadota bacterium]
MAALSFSARTVVIGGPTAVGKTAVGIEVARRLGGQVISADSRQVYRHLDIGTAKPSAAEQAAIRHHLIDLVDPDERFSAGHFGREARRLAAELDARGVVPVLVGGSGFYLGAFVDGLFAGGEVPAPVRAALRDRLRVEGLASLYAELGRLDPVTQQRLSPGDRQRVLRALELAAAGPAGGPRNLLAGEREPLPCVPAMVCLHVSREELYRRVDARTIAMVEAGWLREVEAVLARGFPPQAPGLDCLGYQEMAACAAGESSLDAAIASIQRRTRQFAKQQLTWFRRDRRWRWIDVGRAGVQAAADRIEAHWRRCSVVAPRPSSCR